MSNDRPVQVEDASLSTVSIEVKVLRIGKKQMTLAVYRQLPRRRLIRDDGTVEGQAWGHVNYHYESCPPEDHLHVIFQSGSSLWRDAVTRHSPYLTGLDSVVDTAAHTWLLSAALRGWTPNGRWTPDTGSTGRGSLVFDDLGMRLKLLLDFDISYVLMADQRRREAQNVWWAEQAETQIARSRSNIEALLAKEAGGLTHEEIEAKARDAVNAYLGHERRYAESYAQLAALDQLFIAV